MSKNSIELNNEIVNYIKNIFNDEEAQKFFNFYQQAHSTFIRINTLKADTNKIQEKLLNFYNITSEKIPSIPNALRLTSNENIIGKTIEHLIGIFYIQSLSSMIPPLVLKPRKDEIILDLCASPGSKSTQIAEMMNNEGTLILNEIQADRVKALAFNIDRMNIINAGIIHGKGELLCKIYQNYFDKILVDAPCSGLGIIQKKGEVNNWWSLNRVNSLSEIQYKLLVSALKMLKVGGELIYSTCTFTVEENEMIINKILDKFPIEVEKINLPVDSVSAFTNFNGVNFNHEISNGKRIIPWVVNSEGFFIIKIKKKDFISLPEKLELLEKNIEFLSYKRFTNEFKFLENEFGINPVAFEKYKYIVRQNYIYFINENWTDKNLGLFNRIGIKFGSFGKNREIILSTLASQIFQNVINKNIYEIQSRNELKTYLDGGIIKGSFNLKGQIAVKYNDNILGTAIVTFNGIKSRFPRANRTQEIFIN